MYRVANTLSYGFRKLHSLGNVSNQAQKSMNSYSFLREEYEVFTKRAFSWNAPTILAGPPRCGKTVLAHQYLQKQQNWYTIKHDLSLVESCGMDIVKSFAMAFNNHLENLEIIYENPEVPKTIADKLNINKYLCRTPKIKMSDANSSHVSYRILDAIASQENIGEKPFLMLLDDFDIIHLKNELEWTRQLLLDFSKLIDKKLLKSIWIGKNSNKILYYFLLMKTRPIVPVTVSIGFLSKSDMMKYLQEKQLSLPICNKIYDCFGGDIDIVSNLLTNKENQITEADIQLYYQSMICSRLISLKDTEYSLSAKERNVLKEIYRRLEISEWIPLIECIEEFSESILIKLVDSNLLSVTFMWHASEDVSTRTNTCMVTYPYPWCKHVAKEFLKQ